MSSSDPIASIDLEIDAGDPFTEINIVDGNLRNVELAENMGKISVSLPRGIYEVSFHSGDDLLHQETVIIKDVSKPHPGVQLPEEARKFESAVPLARTRVSDSNRLDAGSISRSDAKTPKGMEGGSGLMLYLRFDKEVSNPGENIFIHDMAGKLVHKLSDSSTSTNHSTGINLNVNPGPYVLRYKSATQTVEQIVYTFGSWQTQVFLAMQKVDAESTEDLGDMSIIMRRINQGFDPDDPATELAARAIEALESQGRLSGEKISDIDPDLIASIKKEAPLLRLYAGLLHLRKPKISIQLLQETFEALNNLMPGHPDVLAIGWATALSAREEPEGQRLLKTLAGMGPIETPPMLRESWKHLLHATLFNPDLIPETSPALGISAQVIEHGAWLRWEGRLRAAPRRSIFMKIKGFVKRHGGPIFLKVAESSLKVEIPKLVKYLSEHEEVWPLVDSHHLTPIEKRVAIFLFPLLDSSMQRMTRNAKKLRQRLVNQALDDMPSEYDMLRALNVPIGKMLLSLSTFNQKLTKRSLLTNRMTKRVAMKWESQGDEVFYDALYSLRKEDTSIAKESGRNRVNLLELLYLRRHGSLLTLSSGPLTPQEIADLLSSEKYLCRQESDEITEQDIRKELKSFEEKFPLPDRYANDERGYDAWLDDRSPLRGEVE